MEESEIGFLKSMRVLLLILGSAPICLYIFHPNSRHNTHEQPQNANKKAPKITLIAISMR